MYNVLMDGSEYDCFLCKQRCKTFVVEFLQPLCLDCIMMLSVTIAGSGPIGQLIPDMLRAAAAEPNDELKEKIRYVKEQSEREKEFVERHSKN